MDGFLSCLCWGLFGVQETTVPVVSNKLKEFAISLYYNMNDIIIYCNYPS